MNTVHVTSVDELRRSYFEIFASCEFKLNLLFGERERERNCLLSFSAILKVDERNSPTRDTLFSDERRRHVSLRCLFSRIIIVTGEVDCEKASRERLIR